GWDYYGPGRAVAVYPPSLDLGPQDRGAVAVARFEIRNAGRGELIVDRFQSSCSCAGVEREERGELVRVKSLHIPPRGRAELVVRINVGAPIGESQPVQIVFRTNDPASSLGQIDLLVPLVTGGVFSSPRAVVFGSLRVGEVARRVVDLYDAGALSRGVGRVHSTRPDRFTVRLMAPTED